MSDNLEPKVPPKIEAPSDDTMKRLIAKVSDNPAKVEFPTDPWGFTSSIRKEVLKAASQVKGREDKHKLLVGTLAILLQHIVLRKEGDKVFEEMRRKDHQDYMDNLAIRQRVGAGPVNVTKDS